MKKVEEKRRIHSLYHNVFMKEVEEEVKSGLKNHVRYLSFKETDPDLSELNRLLESLYSSEGINKVRNRTGYYHFVEWLIENDKIKIVSYG